VYEASSFSTTLKYQGKPAVRLGLFDCFNWTQGVRNNLKAYKKGGMLTTMAVDYIRRCTDECAWSTAVKSCEEEIKKDLADLMDECTLTSRVTCLGRL